MAVARLFSEISMLRRVLAPSDFRAAMLQLAVNAPEILRRRNLSPLDKAMRRDVTISYRDRDIVIPAATIDALLDGFGDTATFGTIREMFGGDVYLRAFRDLGSMETVADLGSNRGFFSLIAAKLWNPRQIVSVEPQLQYNAVFATIIQENGLDAARIARINKFASGTDDDRNVSVAGIMQQFGLDRLSFVKCDIEGGEFSAFKDNPDVVSRIDNLAMEVHPQHGSVAKLVEFLRSTGMQVAPADQHCNVVAPDDAMYVYGSRLGRLAPHLQYLRALSSVLSLRNATLKLQGKPVLGDLALDIGAGCWAFLYGPPGAGKTMLLRLAAGALEPSGGVVTRTGQAALILHDHPMDDRSKALDIVAKAFGGADGRDRAAALMEDLGLEAYFAHEPFRLSRGFRKRLAIAEAIASGARLICLDDPFSPLDRAARATTADVLRAAAEAGATILMASNDASDGLRYGDRIILLSVGPGARIVENFENTPRPDATPEDIAADPVFEKIEAAL